MVATRAPFSPAKTPPAKLRTIALKKEYNLRKRPATQGRYSRNVRARKEAVEQKGAELAEMVENVPRPAPVPDVPLTLTAHTERYRMVPNVIHHFAGLFSPEQYVDFQGQLLQLGMYLNPNYVPGLTRADLDRHNALLQQASPRGFYDFQGYHASLSSQLEYPSGDPSTVTRDEYETRGGPDPEKMVLPL